MPAPSKLDQFRQQNPAYKDVPDAKLAAALHKKFYSEMPEAEFHAKIGLAPEPEKHGASPSKVRPWADVQQSAQFQQLTPEQQQRAQRQYFDQVVVPKLADPSHRGAAWKQFQDWEPTPEAEPEKPGMFDRLNDLRKSMQDEANAPEGGQAPSAPPKIQLIPGFDRKPDSVMADLKPEQRGTSPVTQQSRDQIQAAYDRDPAGRAALLKRDDWRGQVAREIDNGRTAVEDLPTAAALDTRHEAVAQRARGAGADWDTAQSIATGGDTRPVATASESPESLADRLGRMAAEKTGDEQARTIVKGAVDLAGSVAKVAPTTGKMALDAVQLVPLIGQVAEIGSDALADVIEDLSKMQSGEMQGKAAQLSETVRNGTPDQVMQLLLQNPDLLADVAIPSAGSILLIGGAGGAVGKIQAARYADKLSPRALARIQQRAATEGAIWANAAANAGAAYDETEGNELSKYTAALIAGAGTRAVGIATRGGAEGAIARGATRTDANPVANVGRIMGREMTQEFGEGGSEATGVQTGDIMEGRRDGYDLRQIANQATLESAAAGPMGAAVGAMTARPRAEAQEGTIGDFTEGMSFDSAGIDAAARRAFDPARAQLEMQLSQRERDAMAGGDVLELAVVRLENQAARKSFDQEQAEQTAIDQVAPTPQIEQPPTAIDQAAQFEQSGTAAAIDEEQDAAAIDQDQLLDDVMLMASGKPFPSEKAAAVSAKQRKLDMIPVQVGTGWGLVPRQATPRDQTSVNVPMAGRQVAPAADQAAPDTVTTQREQIVSQMQSIEATAAARRDADDATGLPSYGGHSVEGRVTLLDWMTQAEREQFETLRQQLPSQGDEAAAARARLANKRQNVNRPGESAPAPADETAPADQAAPAPAPKQAAPKAPNAEAFSAASGAANRAIYGKLWSSSAARQFEARFRSAFVKAGGSNKDAQRILDEATRRQAERTRGQGPIQFLSQSDLTAAARSLGVLPEVEQPTAPADQAAPAPRQAAPMLMSSGKPFSTARQAATSARQRKLDMRPVKVDGGWALLPTDQAPLPKPWALNQDDFAALARIEKDGNRWSARWGEQYLEGGLEEFNHPDLGRTVVSGGRFFGTRKEAETAARGAHKRAVRRALMNGEQVGADVLAMYPDLAQQAEQNTPSAPKDDASARVRKQQAIDAKLRLEGQWQRLMSATPEAVAVELTQDDAREHLARLDAAPGDNPQARAVLNAILAPADNGAASTPSTAPAQSTPSAPVTAPSRFDVVLPDGSVFGTYSDRRDADRALGRAGTGAQVVVRQAPSAPSKAPKPTKAQSDTPKPTRTRRDGRTALLASIEAAKSRTADPELVARYQAAREELAATDRAIGLKKTKRDEREKLEARAAKLERELESLRKSIGYVTFKTPTGAYRVLNTPDNLATFAKRVRATAAFKLSPPSVEALYENVETRPDTTDAQRVSGRGAIAALVARISARSVDADRDPVTVLGSALYEGFLSTGGVSLRGQTIESAHDLAVLAQVFRDPRFETFRVFFTDDSGKIIGEAGYSSRLPAAVYLPTVEADIARDKTAFGASGYWVLHNHPSGRALPSTADEHLTRSIAAAVPGFAGHVVIDRNEFAIIEADGLGRVIPAPELEGVDFHSKPELEHALLGVQAGTPKEVATIAKALQIPGGHATLVFTRASGQVQLLVDMPAALLQDDTQLGIAKVKAVIRRAARAVGAGGYRFVVLPDGASMTGMRHLIDNGIFVDVVAADGRGLHDSAAWPGDFLDKHTRAAMRVAGPYTHGSEYLATAEQHGGREAWQRAKEAGQTLLDYRPWVQVRTPSFIEWFGDWQNGTATRAATSPTIDPTTGEPRVFYGTGASAFDWQRIKRTDAGWLGQGAYFTTSEAVARVRAAASRQPVTEVFVRSENAFPATAEFKRQLAEAGRGAIAAEAIKIRAAGHDGASFTTASGAVDFVAFEPQDIRPVSTHDTGLDPLDADVVREDGPADYGQAADDQAEPSNPPPPETRFQAAQRVIQDRFNRFNVVQTWLAEQGIVLSEQADVFRAEERMHGRAATRMEDFRKNRVQPIIERIRKAGYTMADVSQFLHAQHAEERNNQVAKLNKSMPDAGSGMPTAEARQILANAPAGLADLANELQDITNDTRQMLLDSGIISQEMADAWTAAYAHYVPLKGDGSQDAAKSGTGKGLTVKQKSRRALGHATRDEAIVENILRDHERAILQVEKNRVGQHLLKMTLEAANDELITIGKPTKRQVLRDQKAYVVRYKGAVLESFAALADAQRFVGQQTARGQKRGDYTIETSHDLDVVLMPSPVLDESETQIYVKGHAIRIQFKDDGLARAWNALGIEHMNVIFRVARMANTWMSKAYTAYNPEFLSVNIMRDFTTGVMNLTGEEGIGFAMRTVKNYPKAFGELLRYAFTGNASNWIAQYRGDGGTTGAAYLSDLERIGADIQASYDDAAGLAETLKAGGSARAARVAGRKTLGLFVGWVEKLNQAGENAMRLAAYRTAVESGMSRAQAASLAKNATVNFNRRGELGSAVSALYLFANPAIQGSAVIAHALFKGKHKHQAQALTGGLVALGYLWAAGLGGGDEDEWEKVGEHGKERFLHIWTGDGWAKIPIPYGYGFFLTLGRHLAELERGADPKTIALRIASNFVEEFTVWGAAADAEGDEKNVMFLLPTLAQITMAPILNRTSLGGPVMPESAFDESRPDNLRMWRSTQGTVWHSTAEGLNALTGGNAAEKGWLDISPETMKFLWNTATGGTGRFITDTATLVRNLTIEGLAPSDIETREVPIVRRFVADGGDIRGARARFWEHAGEAREAMQAFRRAAKLEDHAQREKLTSKILAERGELMSLAKAADRYSAAISAHRDLVQAVMADRSLPLRERRAQVRELEREEAQLYDDFISLFRETVPTRR